MKGATEAAQAAEPREKDSVGTIIFIAIGGAVAWMETTTPFIHDSAKAKWIVAAIILVPAAIALLVRERRKKAKAAARKPAPRTYSIYGGPR